jgi:hypothetical protein
LIIDSDILSLEYQLATVSTGSAEMEFLVISPFYSQFLLLADSKKTILFSGF